MTLEPPEILKIKTKTVACDGGEGALGHPRVFLNMGENEQVECPYCDRLFILSNDSTDKKKA